MGVRFSHPQPRKPQSQLAAVFSGHSAVGSAPRSGRGGRGFKSRCSDQKEPVHIRVLVFFVSARDLNRAAVRSTANKAIVWLCLARGSHRLGMSNRVHAANTFVYWFFFVSARDLQQRRPLPAAETGRSCWGRVLIFQSPVKGLRKNQQTQPVGRRRSDDVTGPTG